MLLPLEVEGRKENWLLSAHKQMYVIYLVVKRASCLQCSFQINPVSFCRVKLLMNRIIISPPQSSVATT